MIHRRVIGGRRLFGTSELHPSRRADVASARSLKGEDQGWVLTGFAFFSGQPPGALHFFPIYLFSNRVSKDYSGSIHFEKQYVIFRELPIAPVFLHPGPFCSYEIVSQLRKSFRKKTVQHGPHIPSANLGYGSTEPVCSLTPSLVSWSHKTVLSSRREAVFVICFHLTR